LPDGRGRLEQPDRHAGGEQAGHAPGAAVLRGGRPAGEVPALRRAAGRVARRGARPRAPDAAGPGTDAGDRGRPVVGPDSGFAVSGPADQRLLLGPHRRPTAHAVTAKRLLTCGVGSLWSRRSARTRKQRAWTRSMASWRVCPYVSTPESSDTSASQR